MGHVYQLDDYRRMPKGIVFPKDMLTEEECFFYKQCCACISLASSVSIDDMDEETSLAAAFDNNPLELMDFFDYIQDIATIPIDEAKNIALNHFFSDVKIHDFLITLLAIEITQSLEEGVIDRYLERKFPLSTYEH